MSYRDPTDMGWTPPPPDRLARGPLADALLQVVRGMDRGRVVSVEGNWGSGKTYVLHHLAHVTRRERGKRAYGAYWLNPWQFGTPDLVSPLIHSMLRHAEQLVGETDPASATRPRLLEIAKVLLPGLAHLGLKGAGIALGFGAAAELGKLFSETAGPAAQLLRDILTHAAPAGAGGGGAKVDEAKLTVALEEVARRAAAPDAIQQSVEALRDLVHLLISLEVTPAGNDDAPAPQPGEPTPDRLFVFIDDLDRCLPSRQVALLEALHFLTSGKAAITFVVALDPRLADAALRTHYGTDTFDTEGYLQKLFDFRLQLPSASSGHMPDFFVAELVRVKLLKEPVPDDVRARLKNAVTDLMDVFPGATPRDIEKIVGRMRLQMVSDPRALGACDGRTVLWHYLALKRPDLRSLLVDVGPNLLVELWRTDRASLKRRTSDPTGSAPHRLVQKIQREKAVSDAFAVLLGTRPGAPEEFDAAEQRAVLRAGELHDLDRRLRSVGL